MYLYNFRTITYCILASNILSFTSGHVFAFGESRALAIANMVLGLKEIQIRGEIRTNVDYTIDLLNVNYSHMMTNYCARRLLNTQVTLVQCLISGFRLQRKQNSHRMAGQ